MIINIKYLLSKISIMIRKGRVITTDFNLVEVIPVCKEVDEGSLLCAAVDSNGNLYVWGILKQFLPFEQTILNQTWDEKVTDEDFIQLTKQLFE